MNGTICTTSYVDEDYFYSSYDKIIYEFPDYTCTGESGYYLTAEYTVTLTSILYSTFTYY
ncbi:uncharacterized protein ASCRUDRAFT_77109 [Ascoidea rubescens DSM 1968]|uniref:Uncharacterized protein n=1 Tax=Ascoidea rubescens DSM 1968 TaxID=1344418 RepID=A0A1D2VCK8_9ASCO|nr:hypothetical protein ASCRUDRAFT_77109 [Ascoidea rubescens DSM 1968]ODV59365.1 hypothetical protein ASCRUDRAFT_77109 [Ascoidea rubescens DSM 1968]